MKTLRTPLTSNSWPGLSEFPVSRRSPSWVPPIESLGFIGFPGCPILGSRREKRRELRQESRIQFENWGIQTNCLVQCLALGMQAMFVFRSLQSKRPIVCLRSGVCTYSFVCFRHPHFRSQSFPTTTCFDRYVCQQQHFWISISIQQHFPRAYTRNRHTTPNT